jgi:hypothetical protein
LYTDLVSCACEKVGGGVTVEIIVIVGFAEFKIAVVVVKWVGCAKMY